MLWRVGYKVDEPVGWGGCTQWGRHHTQWGGVDQLLLQSSPKEKCLKSFCILCCSGGHFKGQLLYAIHLQR